MDITRGPSQALGHAAFYLGPPAPMTNFPVISLEWEPSGSRGIDGCSVKIPPGEKGSGAAEMAQWVKVLATQA